MIKRLSLFLKRSPLLFAAAYFVWRRLLQAKYTVGVVGVLLDEQGRVLLVEHVFHPKHPWGLPGGWVDRNEDPAQSVRRELQEELNLQVEIGPVILTEVPFPNHLDMAYLCRTTDKIGDLSYEISNYGWFTADNLPKLGGFHGKAVRHVFANLTEYQAWLHHH